MNNILRISDYETRAKEVLTTMAWEYLDSAAGDELTLKWNMTAFDRIQFLPRVLCDVSELDISVELFGERLPHPVLLAPIAYHKLFHKNGEPESAKGAALAQSVYCVSTMTNTSIEEIAQSSPDTKLWYQLYVQRDRGYTKSLLERVEAAGARAIVVTVDTPVLGNRVREARAGFHLPEGISRAMLEGLPKELQITGHDTDLQGIYYPLCDPKLSWNDIEWIVKNSNLPVVLKGLLHPDDADIAIQSGAQGVIVSNHGARNLDTVPPTIEMLPDIVERVDGEIPVLFDGGIRRGTDILKAMALGASAVMIGRPYMWGMAVNGAEGIEKAVNLLLTEMKIAMALCGRSVLSEIDEGILL
jgi:4-hydroxymandelate oxidase